MFEAVLFAWVFGIDKGWKEITEGADIKLPLILKPILKYVTPVLLILVFFSSFIRPQNDDWTNISITGWKLHNESILGQIMHKGIGPNNTYFADQYFAENEGTVEGIIIDNEKQYLKIVSDNQSAKQYLVKNNYTVIVKPGEKITIGTPIFKGNMINRIFFLDMTRILLLGLFVIVSLLVYFAFKRRKLENNISV